MSHPDYSRYTLEDFVFDDDFRAWVLQPGETRNVYWQQVQERYPHLSSVMADARRMVTDLRVQEDHLTQESYRRIRQVLDDRYRQQEGRPPAGRGIDLGRRWWRIAASAAVLLLVAGGWWYLNRPLNETVRTAFGETRSIRLPDGSTVKLNGNSTLIYSAVWSAGRTREVWLEGEGFFKVAKIRGADGGSSGAVKFVAHTPNLDVAVLGTQFNLNTRHGKTAVTLIEGKIQLVDPADHRSRILEMKPGQQAVRGHKTEKVRLQAVRTEVYDAWTRDLFVFDNTPLRDIAGMLHDTYGLQVRFQTEDLADKRFTADLSRYNLETLLTVIATTFDFEMERSEKQVIFRRRH